MANHAMNMFRASSYNLYIKNSDVQNGNLDLEKFQINEKVLKKSFKKCLDKNKIELSQDISQLDAIDEMVIFGALNFTDRKNKTYNELENSVVHFNF